MSMPKLSFTIPALTSSMISECKMVNDLTILSASSSLILSELKFIRYVTVLPFGIIKKFNSLVYEVSSAAAGCVRRSVTIVVGYVKPVSCFLLSSSTWFPYSCENGSDGS